MADEHNVLFFCADNSARSIMAEALLNHKGNGRFKGHSAGSQPAEAPRQEALAELKTVGISTDGLRTKNWVEFSSRPDPLQIHFVFVLCDSDFGEVCSTVPDLPVTAEWNIPDPAKRSETAENVPRIFHEVFTLLDRRINLLLALQVSELEQMALEQREKKAS